MKIERWDKELIRAALNTLCFPVAKPGAYSTFPRQIVTLHAEPQCASSELPRGSFGALWQGRPEQDSVFFVRSVRLVPLAPSSPLSFVIPQIAIQGEHRSWDVGQASGSRSLHLLSSKGIGGPPVQGLSS